MELPKFYNPVQTLLAARRETTGVGGVSGSGGGANAGEGGRRQQQQGADGVQGAAEDAVMQVLSPIPLSHLFFLRASARRRLWEH